jgi:hypothetical protein
LTGSYSYDREIALSDWSADMLRWVPKTSVSEPKRWQSRAEILKAHLDNLTPAELRCVRPDHYWLRFGYEAWKRNRAHKANFDPNQPRVPAGTPDGGQWTGDGPSLAPARAELTPRRSGTPARKPAAYKLAARGRQSAAYCWNQMQIDMLYCSTRPAPVNAACRAQAMERYAACLTGKPLPPLPF